ncbi:MAG: trypsin-like peptidase domain-containing protein [Pseudomonadota bacterium]|nr:trypsin-like peptidase domain-containing protein [Pseudomonadota bacterium]
MWKALALSAAALVATPALAQEQLFAENIQQIESSELDALQDAIGKTAAITTISPVDEAGRVLRATGSGSAFFMNVEGQNYLWTNNHVVQGATYVRYQLCNQSGAEYQVPMSDFWRDSNRDFASLTLPRSLSGLPSFKPANLDLLREGQEVYLIGSPLGFACSVSKGVLSYNGRHLPRQGLSSMYGDFQTDAALNPGNSGGIALVMQDGELKAIGMNTFIISPTRANIGLGFIQPLDMLQTSHSYMRENAGRTFISSIDANFADLSYEYWVRLGAFNGSFRAFAENGNRGAVIRSMERDGVAALTGLRVGDIIIGVNGFDAENSLMVGYEIANTLPSDEITLRIIRHGHVLEFTLEPSYDNASLQIEDSSTVPTYYWGSTGVESILPAANVLEEYLGAERYIALTPEERAEIAERWDIGNGIVINQIANRSPVHESGINTFTIVEAVEVNGVWVAIHNLDEFNAMMDLQIGKPVPVLVRHLPSEVHSHMNPHAEVVMVTPRYAEK